MSLLPAPVVPVRFKYFLRALQGNTQESQGKVSGGRVPELISGAPAAVLRDYPQQVSGLAAEVF